MSQTRLVLLCQLSQLLKAVKATMFSKFYRFTLLAQGEAWIIGHFGEFDGSGQSQGP